MIEYFNGTHCVRVRRADERELGIRIEIAMASPSGIPCEPFEPFVASQTAYYKDTATLLAEIVRHIMPD